MAEHEHEAHTGHEHKYRIIINLVETTVEQEVLTFKQVTKLAYPNVQDGQDVVYTVTYKNAAGPDRQGTLAEGQSIEVKNGTIINVTRTDKS